MRKWAVLFGHDLTEKEEEQTEAEHYRFWGKQAVFETAYWCSLTLDEEQRVTSCCFCWGAVWFVAVNVIELDDSSFENVWIGERFRVPGRQARGWNWQAFVIGPVQWCWKGQLYLSPDLLSLQYHSSWPCDGHLTSGSQSWLWIEWICSFKQTLSPNTWTRIHGLCCPAAWALELGPALLGVNERAEKGEGLSDDNRIDAGERETELLLLFLMGSSWLQFQIVTFLTMSYFLSLEFTGFLLP